MIKIIKSCNIYAPEPIGVKDILIFGSQIVLLADAIDPPFAGQVPAEVVNAHGLLAFPGFIDGHVHLAGGGGEGGFHTRTPEIALSSLVRGGITSVIGCLGTDSLTRSLEGLYAKAKGLEAEGITARILTGSYRVPIVTLTGDPMKDLVLIDLVVGAGEIALSDHRSAQPTLEELRRLAADIRVGAILSGKAGVINLHLGDGPGGLGLLREIIATTEIPRSQFLPTHINRNERLLDEGIKYALAGGFIDLTAAPEPRQAAGDISACAALARCLERGVPAERIALSSDGQGSLPVYGPSGQLERLDVGSVGSLFREIRDAVVDLGVPLATALQVITRSPAEIYRLEGKGRIQPGFDADLVLVDPDTFGLDTVIAKGRTMMLHTRLLARGAFERASNPAAGCP